MSDLLHMLDRFHLDRDKDANSSFDFNETKSAAHTSKARLNLNRLMTSIPKKEHGFSQWCLLESGTVNLGTANDSEIRCTASQVYRADLTNVSKLPRRWCFKKS